MRLVSDGCKIPNVGAPLPILLLLELQTLV
jgi:hypothetical protein